MQKLRKKQENQLRISHQSEVLQLRKALAALKVELNEIKRSINGANSQTDPQKILLPSMGQCHFISLDQIIYCEADGNYTKIFIQQENKFQTERSRSLLISKTLKSITNLISSSDFIRCHQSFLANKKHAMGYVNKDQMQLMMSGETRIPVSRRNKKMVLDLFF